MKKLFQVWLASWTFQNPRGSSIDQERCTELIRISEPHHKKESQMSEFSKLASVVFGDRRADQKPIVLGLLMLSLAAQCLANPLQFQPTPASAVQSAVVNFSAIPERAEWHPPMVRAPMNRMRELEDDEGHGDRVLLGVGSAEPSYFPATPGRWSIETSPAPSTTFDLAPQGTPQDATGAASAEYLITTTNAGISIHRLSGEYVSSVGAEAFFAAILPPVLPGHGVLPFDPQVRFDKDLNRFVLIYTYLQYPPDLQNVKFARMLVAVSQTANPTGVWNLFSIDGSDGNTGWLDRPYLSVSADLVLIAVGRGPNNQPPTGGVNENRMYAITKESLTQAMPSLFQITLPVQEGRPHYWVPAESSTQHGIVLFGELRDAEGSPTQTQTARITRNANGVVFQPDFSRFPRQAEFGNYTNYNRQLGTTTPIVGCGGVFSATITSNRITLLQGTYLSYLDGYISGARVLELDSTTLLPISFADLDGRFEQRAICLATLKRNERGDTLVGFSTATPLSSLSAAYSLRYAEDPVDQFRPPYIYQPGVVAFEGSRIGDYSITTVGYNGIDFWTLQESARQTFATTATWAMIKPATPGVVLTFRSANYDPPPGTVGCFFGLRWSKLGIPSPSQYNVEEVCRNGTQSIVNVPANQNYLRTHSGPLSVSCKPGRENQYRIQACNDKDCSAWSTPVAHTPTETECAFGD